LGQSAIIPPEISVSILPFRSAALLYRRAASEKKLQKAQFFWMQPELRVQ
jgi:hypothetical protein